MAHVVYFIYYLFNPKNSGIRSTSKTIENGEKKAKSYHVDDAKGRGSEFFR